MSISFFARFSLEEGSRLFCVWPIEQNMNCFLTGASGFIGGNLARQLAARGHGVKALVRAGSDLRGLAGVDYERVEGDLAQPASLETAMRGCDWCFHVAASYHLWLRDYAPMYAANVTGTRNVLQAAMSAGCRRIVYTSTVGCIGLGRQDQRPFVPGDEETPVTGAQMSNHYKLSKWQAELVAVELAAKGAPVVIVNPKRRANWAAGRQADANGPDRAGFFAAQIAA